MQSTNKQRHKRESGSLGYKQESKEGIEEEKLEIDGDMSR